ncbi:steroid delta-isomerase [Chloroflexia bacterium SDU3-3]|nr:steroid delta-isomerase [Chloroflexia bacterium SDU3-3]
MSYWDADAEYYAHPNDLLAKGADAIRQRHIARFQEPDLFGQLERRDVLGGFVIDHELVTRNFPGGKAQVKVVAIYELRHGKIARAWFIVGAPTPVE